MCLSQALLVRNAVAQAQQGLDPAGIPPLHLIAASDDPGASSGDMRSASLRSVHEDDDKARDVIRTGGWVFQEEGAGQGADTAKGQV